MLENKYMRSIEKAIGSDQDDLGIITGGSKACGPSFLLKPIHFQKRKSDEIVKTEEDEAP